MRYCSPDDTVDGTSMGTCLGAEFDVWMYDFEDAAQMTLEEQDVAIVDSVKSSNPT